MNQRNLLAWARKQVKKKGHIGGLDLFGQIVDHASPKVSADQLVSVLLEASDDPGIHVTEYSAGKHKDDLYYYNPDIKKEQQ